MLLPITATGAGLLGLLGTEELPPDDTFGLAVLGELGPDGADDGCPDGFAPAFGVGTEEPGCPPLGAGLTPNPGTLVASITRGLPNGFGVGVSVCGCDGPPLLSVG